MLKPDRNMKKLDTYIKDSLLDVTPEGMDDRVSSEIVQEYLNRLGSKKRVDRVSIKGQVLTVWTNRNVGATNYIPANIQSCLSKYRFLDPVKEIIIYQEGTGSSIRKPTMMLQPMSIIDHRRLKWIFRAPQANIAVYADPGATIKNLELEADGRSDTTISIFTNRRGAPGLDGVKATADIIKLNQSVPGSPVWITHGSLRAHKLLMIEDWKNPVTDYLVPEAARYVDEHGYIISQKISIPMGVKDIFRSQDI